MTCCLYSHVSHVCEMCHTSQVPGVAQKRGNDGCGDGKISLHPHKSGSSAGSTGAAYPVRFPLGVERCLQFHKKMHFVAVPSSKVLLSVSLCPTSAGAHDMLRLELRIM